MIRKFILVAGLSFFEQGTTVQLMLAQLVCLIFLVMVLNLAPYTKDEADFTNQARRVPRPSLGGILLARSLLLSPLSSSCPPPSLSLSLSLSQGY